MVNEARFALFCHGGGHGWLGLGFVFIRIRGGFFL